MRLIDATAVEFKFPHGYDHDGVLMVPFYSCKRSIENAPTVNAVPISELLNLRDSLYETDRITMNGLKLLNQLIAKYDRSVQNNAVD